MTYRNHTLLRFLVADDEHVRHFVELRLTDFLAELFASDVCVCAQSRRRKFSCNGFCVVCGVAGRFAFVPEEVYA